MRIIGKSKQNESILKATDAELMLLIGEEGEPIEGMFPPGKKIDVAGQWDKLVYFRKHANKLENIVNMLRTSADNIETAIPKD